MNFFDVLIVGGILAAGVGGYRLGFVTRATSWAGMALGLYLAARVVPSVVEAFEGADQLRLFLSVVGILLGGAFLGQALGLVLGARLRVALPEGSAQVADRAAGAFAGAIGVVVAVWLILPSMADVPGRLSTEARNSAVARAIHNVLPEAPDAFQTLREIIGDDRFPEVFDALRPAPSLGPPPASTGISAAVNERVLQSSVKIEGEACNRIQEGSGFVVDTDLVVTNAHVVAGEQETTVIRSDGSRVDAQTVAFDPARDLAVLRAPGLDRPSLDVVDGNTGDGGGVYGYPRGGPLRIAPYQLGQEVEATGTDIYHDERTRRQVYFVAADLAPGDSGAPLVSPQGEVVAVAFAIAPDRDAVAYALTDDEVNALLDRDLSDPVSTGDCV